MGRMFNRTPKKGDPLPLRGLARGLALIDYALTNMTVENGRVEWSPLGAPRIVFGDDGAGSSPAFIENIQSIVEDKRAFGLTFSEDDVIVSPGVIYHAGIAVEMSSPVTITGLAHDDVLCIVYNPSGNTLTVSVCNDIISDTDGEIRRILAKVAVVDGVASLKLWYGGGIEIGAKG